MWLWLSLCLAGGWTQDVGAGYAKTGVRWQAADAPFDDYRDGEGAKHFIGNYNEIGLASYLEVGALDRLTVLGGWSPLTGYLWAEPNTFSYLGTGDPYAGVRIGLVQQRFVLAVQPTVRVPVANANVRQPFVDADTGEPLGELRVGAGVFDLSMALQPGYSWDRGWIASDLGLTWRSGGYRSMASSQIELGRRFGDWMGITRLLYVAPFGPSRAPLDNSPSGIGNGASYPGFSGEIARKIAAVTWLGFIGEGSFFYRRQGGGPVSRLYIAADW